MAKPSIKGRGAPISAEGNPSNGNPAALPFSVYPRASVDRSESENSLEVVVVGGGTNTYWSGGDFSYVSSAAVDSWR